MPPSGNYCLDPPLLYQHIARPMNLRHYVTAPFVSAELRNITGISRGINNRSVSLINTQFHYSIQSKKWKNINTGLLHKNALTTSHANYLQ